MILFILLVVFFYVFDLLVCYFVGVSVVELIGKFFVLLFFAVDGYLGIMIIFGVFVFFWFVGIYGLFIVELVIAVIIYVNVEVNLNFF